MARQGIFTGFTPNDGLGDSLASGAVKVNANFTEIYNTFGDGTNLSVSAGSGGTWTKAAETGIVTSKNVGIGTTNPTASLYVSGNVQLTGITTGTFVGDGSGLTGVTAVGQGVVIKDSGTLIGVAQSINLDRNLDVTQVFGGNVTVSAADTVGFAWTAGFSTSSGYAPLVGLATVATTAGFANTATLAYDANYATQAGIVTYSSASGVATESGFTQYAFLAGVSTYSPTAGFSTLSGYATTTGIATVAQNLTGTPSITIDNINSAIGIVTFPGQGSKMRFDFDALGDMPQATSWRGMFAFSNNPGRAYVSSGTTVGGHNGWRQILHQDQYGNYQTVGIITASYLAGDGSGLTNLPSTDSIWSANSTGINTLGNVGIGTTTADYKLKVVGNLGLSGRLDGTATDNVLPHLWSAYSALPTASTVHGQFAHAHDTESAYFAHDGNWIKLASHNIDNTVGTGTEFYRVGVLTATTLHGDGSNLTNLSVATGYANTAGIATVAEGLTGNPNVSVSQLTAANITSSGVITSTGFVGDGSGLTGITASGSGVVIKDGGTTVGTAGTIDFGANLSVSPASAGVVTVTGGAGSGGIDGISTTGTSTFNDLVATQLNVSGLSTLTGNISVGGSIFVPDNKKLFFGAGNDLTIWHDGNNSHITDTGTGALVLDCDSGLQMKWGGSTKLEASSGGLIVTGVVTATKFIGDGSGLSGVSAAAGIIIKEEGTIVGSGVTFINFVGTGVTATASGAGATVTISATGGGGGSISTTGFGTYTASPGTPVNIDSIPMASYSGGEYTFMVGLGTYRQSQKVLVMHDGTTAYSQEYGIMYTPEQQVSISAAVVSTNVVVSLTPEAGISGLTTYRFVKTLIQNI